MVHTKSKDEQFLYKLLLIEIPSNIIDIIINYSSKLCDSSSCNKLYLHKGVNCEICESQYCCKECYSCQKCDKCKGLVCESCFITCNKCFMCFCFECMIKYSDLYEIYYYCVTCYESKYE